MFCKIVSIQPRYQLLRCMKLRIPYKIMYQSVLWNLQKTLLGNNKPVANFWYWPILGSGAEEDLCSVIVGHDVSAWIFLCAQPVEPADGENGHWTVAARAGDGAGAAVDAGPAPTAAWAWGWNGAGAVTLCHKPQLMSKVRRAFPVLQWCQTTWGEEGWPLFWLQTELHAYKMKFLWNWHILLIPRYQYNTNRVCTEENPRVSVHNPSPRWALPTAVIILHDKQSCRKVFAFLHGDGVTGN